MDRVICVDGCTADVLLPRGRIGGIGLACVPSRLDGEDADIDAGVPPGLDLVFAVSGVLSGYVQDRGASAFWDGALQGGLCLVVLADGSPPH